MPSELYAFSELIATALRQLTVLPSDPALRLAVYSALALAGLTLIVMLNVLVLAELGARRERRRAAFVRHWRPVLTAWSLEENPALPSPPKRGEERLWFLLMWMQLQRQLRGGATQKLDALLDRLAMDVYVVELLENRGVHRRLLALACLRYYGEEKHWEAVVSRIHSPNPVESLAAAEALVAMNAARAMHVLVPLYVQRRDWARPRFAALCRQAGRRAVGPPLLAALEQQASSRVVALLEWAPPNDAAGWARQCLQTPLSSESDLDQRDSVCAALRCLGELHDPQDRPLIEATLESPLADVRVEAVKALKRQANQDDERRFIQCLSDANWWVRQAAADALVALPGRDIARLQAVLGSLEDRYGHDALHRAMVEANVMANVEEKR